MRYRRAVKFLDERGRRLFAANEALALGYGGVTAAGAATGLARSTIRRGIVELHGGSNLLGQGVRRPGGGRKRAVALQPGLLATLEALPPRSVGAVTAFHLVEYLPLPQLVQVFDETVRVLAPGGVAVFETPNPLHPQVSAHDFHLDPGRRRPLPAALARFLAEERGLCRVAVLTPPGEAEPPRTYALVGYSA